MCLCRCHWGCSRPEWSPNGAGLGSTMEGWTRLWHAIFTQNSNFWPALSWASSENSSSQWMVTVFSILTRTFLKKKRKLVWRLKVPDNLIRNYVRAIGNSLLPKLPSPPLSSQHGEKSFSVGWHWIFSFYECSLKGEVTLHAKATGNGAELHVFDV